MPALKDPLLAQLLRPFYPEPPPALLAQLSLYLDLLLKWNAKTNLTAIRDPEEIVRRHFGESLFTARHLPSGPATLLDLGSGAGFPGLPIALVRPEFTVTLAESQNKKASFLREAVRVLGLEVEVWAARTESLPPARRFDIITMRAVDNPLEAMKEAERLLAPGGQIALLASDFQGVGTRLPIPGSSTTNLYLL